MVWGEVLASAVFEPSLRDQLRAANDTWVALVAERIRRPWPTGRCAPTASRRARAERLTALVDGLSARWLAGLYERERARRAARGRDRSELDPPNVGLD